MKKTDPHDPGKADYTPISCDVYSELEVAILHRTRLRIAWREGNVCHTHVVMPLDLQTRDHQEFLHCRLEAGDVVALRLDRITHLERA
ncbi:transcriptional antiterminator, Rof [Sulfurifustis variabilis]|uniref:Transcriptional antiterminator, Rof n=1 Tax=Sulfurifustis variabilis TaxID=1675686 RepID=A0A1B4VGZ3_9GAMM|nr:Rho-binding antiterminator [Sulfurifustis variabilis]BAU50217.1 transcriptional antiterminator, Rof [Sulfurifustis variabilis]